MSRIPDVRAGLTRSATVELGNSGTEPGRPTPHHGISSRVVLRMTGSLVAVSLLNAGVGFLFWWVAARLFEPAAIGIAAAAVSAMVLLGRISVLGLGMALIGELPRVRVARSSLILAALFAAGGTGILLAGGFALLVPVISPELAPMTSSVAAVAIFGVGVALSSIATVLDQVLVGLLRGGLQLTRNVVFSVSKLAALTVAGLWLVHDAVVVYSAWTAGIAVSLAVIGGFAWRAGFLVSGLPLAWSPLSSLVRAAMSHHALTLSRYAPVSIMPIAVTAILSAADAAAFFIALLIANYVNVVGHSATLTLYAVGARAPEQMSRQLRLTMGVSVASAVVGSLVLIVAGRPVLSLFGPEYAQSGFPAIALLTLRAFPLLIKDHWIAIKRVERGVGIAALAGWAGVILQVALAVIGAHMAGLLGLSIGWLVALIIELVLIAPTVYRSARSRRPVSLEPEGPGA